MPTRRQVIHRAGLASLLASCQVLRNSSTTESLQNLDSFPASIRSSGRLVMQSAASYEPNNQDSNSIIRLNAISQSLKESGNVSGRAYPNYADATRTDWPTAYYA